MRFLLTSDLHLTERKLDKYRWGLFPYLKRRASNYNCDALFVGGDVTDKKDRHPAVLVNRLLREFESLAESFSEGIHIVMGNHDYIDPSDAFFSEALDRLPSVTFYDKLTFATVGGVRCAFVPHTDRHRTDWNETKGTPFPQWSEIDFALFHQTFTGAIASNGTTMSNGLGQKHVWDTLGVPSRATLVSGDIHVPQKVGRITYIGSPYPVSFGDSFQPRVLIYDAEKRTLFSKKRTTIKKAVIRVSTPEEIFDAGLSKGDMVRVFFEIPRSRIGEWKSLRGTAIQNCIKLGVYCRSVELREKKTKLPSLSKSTKASSNKRQDHAAVVRRFSSFQKLSPSVLETGLSLLEEAR